MKVCALPVQVTPAFKYDGVTVTVEIIAALVAFVVVKVVMSPVAPELNPVVVLSFDQV